jgi:hypothetical protein
MSIYLSVKFKIKLRTNLYDGVKISTSRRNAIEGLLVDNSFGYIPHVGVFDYMRKTQLLPFYQPRRNQPHERLPLVISSVILVIRPYFSYGYSCTLYLINQIIVTFYIVLERTLTFQMLYCYVYSPKFENLYIKNNGVCASLKLISSVKIMWFSL